MDGTQTLSMQRGQMAILPGVAIPVQRSLKTAIGCVGVGLHSGRKIAMTMRPATAGEGIVFRRMDLPGAPEIAARYDNVVDTTLCTVLGLQDHPEIRVATVEHVLAAFAGCGISNAVIEVDGPEVPVLDGSATNFVFLIDCAGIVEQDVPVEVIEVMRPVRVRDGKAYAELLPCPFGFEAAVSIAFEAAAVGSQSISMRVTPDSFRSELARARTFTMAGDVERLRAAGLALGGSLDNAVVVDDDRVLNPGGLRMADEFVRHKLLDAVGDLALAGAALRGRLVSHRCGHALNNKLVRALFSDRSNWRTVPAEPTAFRQMRPLSGRQPDLRIAAAAA